MVAGIVRAPRAFLSVVGGNMTPTELAVEMTTYRKADTFSAHVPLDAVPGLDEFFWSDLPSTQITINATNDATTGGYLPLFVGNVDDVDIDWGARVARVSGRDLGAALLETKTTEKFQNQTTAQIVKTIAQRIGLTANVQVPSGDRVGLVYKTDYARITDQDTLMNVLARLAQRSGCVFWISGTTLNFMPDTSLATLPPFVINYIAPTPASIAQGNFVTLRTRRNYVLSKTIQLRTRSWQLKQKQTISSEYNMPGSVSGNLVYEYRAPNMTQEQANAYTQARLNELSSREKTVDIDLPGDVTLTPEMQVQLVGTGTSFDQLYTINRVSHHFSQGGGYRMFVSTRNRDHKRSAKQAATAGTGETTAPV
jgi:phage protein D